MEEDLELFTRPNAPPHFAGRNTIPQTQEIEDIPTTLPDVAVPARRTRRARRMHPQRRARVFPVVMMPAKRTTGHSTSINPHIASHDRERVLPITPALNVERHITVEQGHTTRPPCYVWVCGWPRPIT